MSDLDIPNLIFGLIVVFAITALHLVVSVLIWRHLARPLALILLAALSFLTAVIWLFVGIGIILISSFCSNCYLPDSPQKRALFITLGLPLGNLKFVLVAVGLFLAALLISVVFAKRIRPRSSAN